MLCQTSPVSTGTACNNRELDCSAVCRELVAKLRSMTETIKMLSTENVALREENDSLLGARQIVSHGRLQLYIDFSIISPQILRQRSFKISLIL